MMTPLATDLRLELAREGVRVRALGRRKDACPYPLDSPERRAWMEGYEGERQDQESDLPTNGT